MKKINHEITLPVLKYKISLQNVRKEIQGILSGKAKLREIKVSNPKIFKYSNEDEAYFAESML